MGVAEMVSNGVRRSAGWTPEGVLSRLEGVGAAEEGGDRTAVVEVRRSPGGQGSTTLNYLVGGTPLEEWRSLCAEEEALIERLRRVTAARSKLELHLALAGVRLSRGVEQEREQG